jgi:alpha-1,3-mannosyltransferase
MQVIFVALYTVAQGLAMRLYIKSGVMPPWSLILLTLSKRLHSIYVLRLFNDCWAIALALAATNLLLETRWAVAICVFSLAVSIKMNVLLFAPGVLVVCLLVCASSLFCLCGTSHPDSGFLNMRRAIPWACISDESPHDI